MIRFFDTHTHIDFLLQKTGQSAASLIEESRKVNVDRAMLMGVSTAQFSRIIRLQKDHPDFFSYGLGLHPFFLSAHQESDLTTLEHILPTLDPPPHLLGEIGLDRYKKELTQKENWKKQCFFFENQLFIAKKHSLPLSVHARHSHNEVYRLLKKHPVTGVIHAFSGSYEEACRYIDLGFKIGVGGVITYERAHKTRSAIARLPKEALVLETDSPDMPIWGKQGLLNRPSNLPLIFSSLCRLTNEDPENLSQILWQNSEAIFNIN